MCAINVHININTNCSEEATEHVVHILPFHLHANFARSYLE